MKPTLGTFSTLSHLSLVLSAPASARTGQTGAVVALHTQPHNNTEITCSGLDPNLLCSEFNSTWPVGVAADVYLVVAKARSNLGISVLSCDIEYAEPVTRNDGVGFDVFGYVSCSDLEYPNSPTGTRPAIFPEPGVGTASSGFGPRIVSRRCGGRTGSMRWSARSRVRLRSGRVRGDPERERGVRARAPGVGLRRARRLEPGPPFPCGEDRFRARGS